MNTFEYKGFVVNYKPSINGTFEIKVSYENETLMYTPFSVPFEGVELDTQYDIDKFLESILGVDEEYLNDVKSEYGIIDDDLTPLKPKLSNFVDEYHYENS